MISGQDHRRLQAGGTLDPRRHIYIERPEDAELLRLLLQGEFCNVLTPRQMGKSSLMARTTFKLLEAGVRYVTIDIGGSLGSAQDPEEWYLGIIAEVSRSLRLTVDVARWWRARLGSTKNQKLLQFFREEVCGRTNGNLVIFLDEIDATLKLPYTDDLFTAIRTIYNQRPFVAQFQQISFCLLGVISPNELIKNPRTTPYNIGHTLHLRDFSEAQDDLSPISSALSRDAQTGRAILIRVLYWTDGHPFLTIKLCEEVLQSGVTKPEEVDAYVESAFTDLDRSGTEVHFQTVLRFFEARVSDQSATLKSYERILRGVPERDQTDLVHTQLKLSGLVKRGEDGRLVLRNRLYARLFDTRWIANVKPKSSLRWRSAAALIFLLASVGSFLFFFLSDLSLEKLPPEQEVGRNLEPDRVHRYEVRLASGQFLSVGVEQVGLDVELRLFDPLGRVLVKVDSPKGGTGTERLAAVAAVQGSYRLEVHALETQDSASEGVPGRYKIAIEDLRMATSVDRERVAAIRALAEGRTFRRREDPQSLRQASEALEIALRLFQKLGDFSGQSETLEELAAVYRGLGQTQRAIEVYRRALPLSRQEAQTAHRLGGLLFESGETVEALDALQRARRLSLQVRDERTFALTLHLMALVYQSRGEWRQSLQHYNQALQVWKRLGGPDEAATLLGRGQLYLSMQSLALASDDLSRALEIFRNREDLRSEALALNALGQIRDLSGAPMEAAAYFKQSLDLMRRAGDRRGEALTLLNLGGVDLKRGRLREANAAYTNALMIFRQLQDRTEEARALNGMGALYNTMGQPMKALEIYSTALVRWQEIGDANGRGEALLGLAVAERKRGNPLVARAQIERAIAVRDDLYGPVAQDRKYFDFYVDLLMDLHGREPFAGYDEKALEVSERFRALVLEGTDAAGVRLHGWPRATESILPHPLLVSEIQNLLNPETLLLEYQLGEKRSFLWAVSPTSIDSFILPAQAEIERAAQRVYELLARRRPHESQKREQILFELSRMVLGPAAPFLGTKRLLIVGDGFLESIPFGSLPSPASSFGMPLLAEHELVSMPSMSALAILRRDTRARPQAPGALAVVADPILDQKYPPLQFAELEAHRILALLPKGTTTLLARGASADRETVLSGTLGRYRIVHFATHTIADSKSPETTGLLLSQFDEDGRPQDSFLRASEIRGLSLPAELVVLSSSRTALARDTRSGSTSLAQAFMQAGAKRVIGSLWNVNDESTAELMIHLYRSMLLNDRRPAEALRLAQLELQKEKRWKDPYYWAGFVFQGEWR